MDPALEFYGTPTFRSNHPLITETELKYITRWVAKQVGFDWTKGYLVFVELNEHEEKHNAWRGRANWSLGTDVNTGNVRIELSLSVSVMEYQKSGPKMVIHNLMEALVVALAHELTHIRLGWLDAVKLISTDPHREGPHERIAQRWEQPTLVKFRRRPPMHARLWLLKNSWRNFFRSEV